MSSRKASSSREALAKNLFLLHPVFREALLKVRAACDELGRTRLHALAPGQVYDLATFVSNHEEAYNHANKMLSDFSRATVHIAQVGAMRCGVVWSSLCVVWVPPPPGVGKARRAGELKRRVWWSGRVQGQLQQGVPGTRQGLGCVLFYSCLCLCLYLALCTQDSCFRAIDLLEQTLLASKEKSSAANKIV